jgi:serine/threonine protein phosphatase 1
MRRLVLGDIHGGYQALLQVLKRCDFDRENDELVVLGDVCDGWPQVKQCINELLKVKNIIYIIGNHDKWTLDWMVTGLRPGIWTSQGGANTIRSYGMQEDVPREHIDFLRNAHLWYEDDGVLFVHGGYNINQRDMEKQNPDDIMWDRDLICYAYKTHLKAKQSGYPEPNITGYKKVFLGHTTTHHFKSEEPVKYCEVWNLDTGGGWEGKLTIMDRDTEEFWQSDNVYEFYPEERGRR